LPPRDDPYWEADKALDILRAAILRGSFPEPAPAEQGEGLDPEVEQFIEIAIEARICEMRCDFPIRAQEEAGERALAYFKALLASRPQPEAKEVPMEKFIDILAPMMTIREVLAVVGYAVKE